MNRSQIRRLVSVTAAAVLMLAALGVGPVAAKTPSGWDINAVRLPETVQAGNDAGYAVTITNIGPSNINAVTASIVTSDTPNATPTYLSAVARNQGDAVTCSETGQLTCSLGTLTPGTVITFTVAYLVPEGTTGAFDLSLRLRAGTGDVEGGNQSRGDAFARPLATGINNNQNFDGGFVTGADVYETVGTLGRQNKQNSSLDVSGNFLPATVEDGSGVQDGNTCTIDECFGAKVGEWTRIDVPSHSGMIQVTMFIWGGNVDGGVQPGGVYALHDPDGAAGAYAIKTICTSDAPTAECVVATKVGNNWKLVVWLKDNGGLRGGY